MRERVREALRLLGKERLALGVHDACFPCDPSEDLGRGSPYGGLARDLLRYAAELGFDTLQLGPQGEQSADNSSPYDSAAFARNALSLSLGRLVEQGLLRDETRERLTRGVDPARSDHRRASRAMDEVVLEVGSSKDALVAAQHAELREHARSLGLALFADLQIGWSPLDVAAHPSAFVPDLRLGAPPSRTNPEGQPWGYPVLDLARPEVVAALVDARFARLAAEYDGVRVDHPHGWVCPWVYRPPSAWFDERQSRAAVRAGARLHESPDLPELARFAYVRRDQLDPGRTRWDDHWVRDLGASQVDLYARHIDRLVTAFGEPRLLACEVLSTMPHPLACVVDRHRLGRFRVTQKVDPDDPRDGYRSEHARGEDWIMVGTHDTEPIWAVTARWIAAGRAGAHARYLEELGIVGVDPGDARSLARAKLVELFLSPARNVYVWWGDWLGETEIYNRPGIVDDRNWQLRIPRDFRAEHARRVAEGAALDLTAALSTALAARGHHDLSRALREGV